MTGPVVPADTVAEAIRVERTVWGPWYAQSEEVHEALARVAGAVAASLPEESRAAFLAACS